MPGKQEKSFKTPHPFGVATKRFCKIGFHPELDISGAMKREITKTGPGSYNPTYNFCKAKKGCSWKLKEELEEYSKYLGFRNSHILRERQLYKSLRGPGTNDVNENVYKKQSCSVLQNVGFGSGEKFRNLKVGQSGAPPPDTYFRNIFKRKPPLTTTPTFEFDGFLDRFKSSQAKYHLPPNRYCPDDRKNLTDISRKVVSKRGPYDTFTGPRDSSTIKNHFGPPAFKVPEFFYIKPSSLDVLLHCPTKQRYGSFLKSDRFTKKPTVRHMLNDLSLCYRSPDDPGPAHYDLIHLNGIKAKPESMAPFDSSNIHARPPTDWKISPGPGRYQIKAPKCMKMKRPSWVFLTKANRNAFDKPDPYALY